MFSFRREKSSDVNGVVDEVNIPSPMKSTLMSTLPNNGLVLGADWNAKNSPVLDPSDSRIENVTYIPLEFAASKIDILNRERIELKSKFESRIQVLTEFYETNINNLKKYYEKYILEVKEKVNGFNISQWA